MSIASELAALEAEGLLRRRRVAGSPCEPEMAIDGRTVLSFASNDYLGLAADPRLIDALAEGARAWGVGAGASHFLGGHFEPHAQLEERLAAFVGAERALLFSTGYMANIGILPALAERGDVIFTDRLNHASLIDAVRLSNAFSHRYPHLDLGVLEGQLAANRGKKRLIVTDAVFSMDGDIAPLPELLALAERFDAWLVIDDAHGFGVLGPRGRGTAACFGLRPGGRLLLMGTLGKAAGVSGAFVAGDGDVIEWLTQKTRTAIFTTAAPPALAVALLQAMGHVVPQHARIPLGKGLLAPEMLQRLLGAGPAVAPRAADAPGRDGAARDNFREQPRRGLGGEPASRGAQTAAGLAGPAAGDTPGRGPGPVGGEAPGAVRSA